MHRYRFIASALLALGLAALPATVAYATAETAALARAYQNVLADPTDTAANMEYARLAEAAGQPRKALATYERVLLYEPENEPARSALLRIRREIQPDKTLVTLQTGIGYESNPQHAVDNPPYFLDGPDGDTKAFANLRIEDERRLGDIRWRTEATADVEYFNQTDIIDSAYLGVLTGPLFDLGTRVTAHPFIGGGMATSDQDFDRYFSEAVVGVSFEGYLEGAYQQLRLKAGYRDYADTFDSVSDGYYVDAVAKWTKPDLLTSADALVLTPHLRWSDIDASDESYSYADLYKPGRYVEYGAKLQYFDQVADWLTLGAGIGVEATDYAHNDNYYTDTQRRDVVISPMASVVFNKIFGVQSDLAVDYRYDWNRSNLDYYDYGNNIVTAKVVTRF